jgi:4-amino-4-deoxy-L-arabinose transferase-like glycosyltransferase
MQRLSRSTADVASAPSRVAFVGQLCKSAEVSSSEPATAGVFRASEGLAHDSLERDVPARLLLAAALIVGLLRFFRLGQWSLWFDEAITWTDAHVSLEGAEITNPLGYRAIAGVVRWLGGVPDEFSLRLLPALLGWCVVPATWWAFKPWAGARRAAAAALLVAASSWHVYWSQNARFYTMAQLVALVGGGILLRGLWNGRAWLAALGLAVAGLGAFLHPSAGLILPAFALAPWLMMLARAPLPRASRKPALVVSALLVAALLVRIDWVVTTWETYQRQKGQAGQSDPAHFVLTSGFYITPLWLTAAAIGGACALRRRDLFHVFASSVIVLVLAAGLVASVRARVSAQYVFVVLPWVAVLACAPLELAEGASSRPSAWFVGWLALLVLPTITTTALYFTVRKGERPQWREAYEFVWNQREPDDLILGMEASVGELYLAPRRTELRYPLHVTWLDTWRSRMPEIWAQHSRRAWYILNPEQLLDWNPRDADDFRAFLREQCRLVKCFPLYVESRDLSVWIYIRD